MISFLTLAETTSTRIEPYVPTSMSLEILMNIDVSDDEPAMTTSTARTSTAETGSGDDQVSDDEPAMTTSTARTSTAGTGSGDDQASGGFDEDDPDEVDELDDR
jgi:hypothetical protein